MARRRREERVRRIYMRARRRGGSRHESALTMAGVLLGGYASATDGFQHSLIGYSPELTLNDLVTGMTGINMVASHQNNKLVWAPGSLANFWVPTAGFYIISRIMRAMRVNVKLTRRWSLF
ncbi:MAG: hypothetical protein QW429_04965 [Thermoprotei archaeon]